MKPKSIVSYQLVTKCSCRSFPNFLSNIKNYPFSVFSFII